MPAPLKTTLDRLNKAVAELSLAQRVFGVLAVIALVISAVAVGGMLSRPTMAPLFSGLSGADASAVIDQLASAGVAYELADGGTTVLVPADKVFSQRIAMAAQGLPTNADGDGYWLLDGLSATSTQFQEQTALQRAMEGELARTIAAMDGVSSASVKLAIPEETVFTRSRQSPTASVFIRQSAGRDLSGSQVQAIVHLVSAAIPGMESTDVAVVDSGGRVLSSVGGQSTLGSAMADQKTGEHQARVEAAIHGLLDPLVGAQNVSVTANAELNFDASRRTVESFQADPDVPPLTSSTRTEEYDGTGAGGATGVLGPDNIAVPGGVGDGQGSYRATSEDVTNAVGKTTEVITAAPGSLERQSVSVVINSRASNALDLVALEAAIAAAAGIDVARGDTLSVQRMPFDETGVIAAEEALAAAEARERAEATQNMIRQAATAGAVLLFLVIAGSVAARRSRRARREALDLGRLEAATAADREQELLEAMPPSEMPELPGAMESSGPDPVALKRQQIAALADEQPEEVADLLRGWLTESGRR
ncbi:MAG: flagellar M-ring protein FliF [Micrococcales bacterium]|nr:flagellar M-ring protein FliF [Micrococcales bacterium]